MVDIKDPTVSFMKSRRANRRHHGQITNSCLTPESNVRPGQPVRERIGQKHYPTDPRNKVGIIGAVKVVVALPAAIVVVVVVVQLLHCTGILECESQANHETSRSVTIRIQVQVP